MGRERTDRRLAMSGEGEGGRASQLGGGWSRGGGDGGGRKGKKGGEATLGEGGSALQWGRVSEREGLSLVATKGERG